MYLESIKEWQGTQCNWVSNLVLTCNNGDNIVKIELCQAVGENARQPEGAVNQPTYQGPKSKFCFDKNQFKGIEAKDDIIKVLRDSFPNCTLFLQDDGKGIRTKNSFLLRFNHYPKVHKTSVKYSNDQKRSKDNTAPYATKESVSKGQDAWKKMKNKK